MKIDEPLFAAVTKDGYIVQTPETYIISNGLDVVKSDLENLKRIGWYDPADEPRIVQVMIVETPDE